MTKLYIKEIIDGFDHAITLWSGDKQEYIEDIKKHSSRWIELPVSPSAEQFSRVIFLLVERVRVEMIITILYITEFLREE